MERYISPDFYLARAATWKIREAWDNGDKSIVNFFVDSTTHADRQQEERTSSGLTVHQNLSWLLHCFGNLAQ